MMRVTSWMRLVISTALLALAAPAWSDVAPYPAWRLVTNGTIAGAVQRDGAIYFGGSFTKVGRGVAPFDGFLELSTLSLIADPGCARDDGTLLPTARSGGSRLIDRRSRPFGTRLSDGAGPFVVGDDVQYVRVGSDCRFDRRFSMRLPVPGTLLGEPVYVGDLLYSAVQVNAPQPWHVAQFEARTGDLLRAWPVPALTSLVGIGTGGRIALTHAEPLKPFTLGHFDPASGSVTTAATLPEWFATVTPLGSRALVAYPTTENGQYVVRLRLYELDEWRQLPAWPEVRTGPSEAQTAVSGTRLVVAAPGLRVGTGAAHALAAFDFDTGAHDVAWLAPEWFDDQATSFIVRIAAAGSRLVVAGNFPPGAPRDGLAALDVTTGALDAWEFPYAPGFSIDRAGRLLSLGRIESVRRVARSHLAAVDAVTGDLLPWEPGALLPPSDFLGVRAVVLEGPHIYAAQGGAVWRYDLGSGTRDPTWRLEVATTGPGFASVTRLAARDAVIHAIGNFNQARTNGTDPFEGRSGGAAATLPGALTAWNPGVHPWCAIGGRVAFIFACISDIAATRDRIFLRGGGFGGLSFLTTPPTSRSFAGVSPETGALDLALPDAATYGFTAADGVLFATLPQNGEVRLARIDPGLRATLLPGRLSSAAGQIAARNGRVYAGGEVDAATGAPTGNATQWPYPAVADDGILDFGVLASGLAFYADLTGVPPGRPIDLQAAVSGSRVALSWTRAPTDLQPLVPAPQTGGTAATSHVIVASLTPGGPPVAQLNTASDDTVFETTAPPGVFFVRVLAKNAFGVSEASTEVRVEVRQSVPDAPVGSVATVLGQEVRVAWQAAPGGWPADGYRLEAGTRSGAADIAAVLVSGLTFRVSGVPPGRYYVRVRAVNANGASEPGAEMVLDVAP